jgi:branched-chain amino acid transport system permease protein
VQAAANILIDALAYGMVLFIISIGLSITLGLMRVINLAHGAFAMIGGYVASYLIVSLGWSFAAALCVAVIATVLIGIPLERLLFRRIYRSHEPLAQILMTVGLTFVVIGLANYVFGPTLKIIPLPGIISGPLDIGIRTLPAHRLFVIACGLAVAGSLWFLVERTSFGVRLRATVDHAGMSAALGVRTELIYAATFALSVGLAAFGGVVGAELLPIEPFYALRYMVTFLVVVSVGGSGSIAGALLGALLLGLTDTVGKYLAPSYGQIFFYAAVIAVVFVFPRGLLPGRAG